MIASRICADCQQPVATRWGLYCEFHLEQRRMSPRKHHWTDERDAIMRQLYDPRIAGRPDELARRFGIPKQQVLVRAVGLGLAHRRAPEVAWTDVEVATLRQHVGRRSPKAIQKFLPNRTISAIVCKIQHMELSSKVEGEYSLNDLVLMFGTTHARVHSWVKARQLKAQQEGWGQGGRWVFTPKAVLKFIQKHPRAFVLARVNQIWFLDLVFNGAVPHRDRLAPDTKVAA